MVKSEGLGKKYRKVTITLGEAQENYIDEVRKKIKKCGGFSLGRTEIIRTAIQLLETVRLNAMDLSNVKNEKDLLEIIKKYVCLK